MTKYAWPVGVAPLHQKSNFCEPKRDNFRNLTPFVLLWTNKISFVIIDMMLIGRQTMINCFVFERWRHTVLCYAILCFATFIPTSSKGRASIAMLPKHALSGHSGRRISNSVTTIWFLFLIISIVFIVLLWFVSFSNADVIPYIFLLEAMLGNTPQLSSHELAYTTPVDTSRFL